MFTSALHLKKMNSSISFSCLQILHHIRVSANLIPLCPTRSIKRDHSDIYNFILHLVLTLPFALLYS